MGNQNSQEQKENSRGVKEQSGKQGYQQMGDKDLSFSHYDDTTSLYSDAWASFMPNKITVCKMDTQTMYPSFEGAQPMTRNKFDWSQWPHLRGIPGSNTLLSVHHAPNDKNAQLKVIGLTANESFAAKTLLVFNIKNEDVGSGDIAYCQRKRVAAILPVSGKILYHVFDTDSVQFCRRTRWHECHKNVVEGIDFDPNGHAIATISRDGTCLVSDFNSNNQLFQMKVKGNEKPAWYNRCRWNPIPDSSQLVVKYSKNQINMIDTTKTKLVFTKPLESSAEDSIYWVDYRNDGNLIASCGMDKVVRVFDMRQGKNIKAMTGIHENYIRTVRWSPDGKQLLTSSWDNTVKLTDFPSGKIAFTAKTEDKSKTSK